MTSKAFGLAQLGNAFADGALSNRNKIINGAMTIDQRNAGASVSLFPSSYNLYGADRWIYNTDVAWDNKATVQQVATAPAGFSNSLLTTVTGTVASPGATDVNCLEHRFEGHNVADLGFGTSNAATVTVSFWVRSSVTGNYGGSLANGGRNRAYPFSYTVFAADTWEKKTVTISGDTSGTWPTGTSRAMILIFSLSSGSTYGSGTANAWSGTYSIQPSGSVNLFATNGATFYITGVQLEAGDTATPFEHRSFGAELALCQRYFCKTYNQSQAPGTATAGVAPIRSTSTGNAYGTIGAWYYPVTMRAVPTITGYAPGSGGAGFFNADSTIYSQLGIHGPTETGAAFYVNDNAIGVNAYFAVHATAAAEL